MAGASELVPVVVPAVPLRSSWQRRVLGWRPPRIALALGAIGVGAHAAVWGMASPWTGSVLAGALLAALGFGWTAWARALFRLADTEMRPSRPPRVFVDDGPFRVGRHPMYLGMVAVLLGAALALGSPAVLLAAATFVLLLNAVHVPFEEAQALRHFGGWYRDYAARVRRWL